MSWPKTIWSGMTDRQRGAIVAWFGGGSANVDATLDAVRAFATAAHKAGLPGTGAGVTPENVADCEQVTAPEPASICAPDDEC